MEMLDTLEMMVNQEQMGIMEVAMAMTSTVRITTGTTTMTRIVTRMRTLPRAARMARRGARAILATAAQHEFGEFGDCGGSIRRWQCGT